jgi:CcmD family protein
VRRRRSWTATSIAAFAAAALAALAPAAARAQEFVKVQGAARQEIPAGPFVAAAYAFIWIAVLVYVVFVARGVARVRRETDELRVKLDRGARPGGPAPGA